MLFRWFFTVFSAMAKVLVFLLDRKNDDPFRRHARRGWPLGSARFLAAVERQTRRPLPWHTGIQSGLAAIDKYGVPGIPAGAPGRRHILMAAVLFPSHVVPGGPPAGSGWRGALSPLSTPRPRGQSHRVRLLPPPLPWLSGLVRCGGALAVVVQTPPPRDPEGIQSP